MIPPGRMYILSHVLMNYLRTVFGELEYFPGVPHLSDHLLDVFGEVPTTTAVPHMATCCLIKTLVWESTETRLLLFSGRCGRRREVLCLIFNY